MFSDGQYGIISAMTAKRLIRISYFTMLTIIGAMIRIPAGPVSFTLQTLFVVLAGFVLGARDGLFAELAYMIIGLISIPVFTTGGGPQYVLQPSFGYIVGFCAGAYTAGRVLRRFRTLKPRQIFVSGIAALLPIYALGMTYQVISLTYILGSMTLRGAVISLINIVYMFIGDAVQIFIVSLIFPRIMTMIGKTEKQKFADNGLNGNSAAPDANAETAAHCDAKTDREPCCTSNAERQKTAHCEADAGGKS